jgi:hypothetical protein
MEEIMGRFVLKDTVINKYYTGRAGEGWIGEDPFVFETVEGAQRKCEVLNRTSGKILNIEFKVVESV